MLYPDTEEPILERKITEALLQLLLPPEPYSPAMQNHIESLTELVGQLNVVPSDGTKMICADCSSVNAPGYKLKRSAGKYIAYCIDELGGCFGKQVRPKCSFVDHVGVECDQLAEFQIAYGSDKIVIRYACVIHTGILLKDTENTVTPLK